MSKTNLGLVEYVKSKVNLPTMYFLSGFGRILTEAQIQRRIDKGDQFTIANVTTIRTGIGRYGFDCVGLIKGYLWEESPGLVDYNIPSGSDQNSEAMYGKAIENGPLNTMPDILGMLVFTADLGHVGVYVGKVNGIRQYIECTPAWEAWGVTTSADSGHPQRHNRKWTYWGKYALIEYVEPAPQYAPMIDVTGKTYIASDNVWIREYPSTSANKLGLLPANTLTDITQISANKQDGYDWVKIQYEHITGFCAIVQATVADKVLAQETPVIVPEPITSPEPEIIITPVVEPIPVEPEPVKPSEPVQEPLPPVEQVIDEVPDIAPQAPNEPTEPLEPVQPPQTEVKPNLLTLILKIIAIIVKALTTKYPRNKL